MSISRSSQVYMSQGDPFLGGLATLGFGAIKKGIGALFKRGASKVVQVAKTSAPAAVAGAAGAAIGVLKRPAGKAAVAGAAGAIAGEILYDKFGRPVSMKRRRRRRGLSATELRGFRKVTNLLAKVGMTPRGLGGRRRRKVC